MRNSRKSNSFRHGLAVEGPQAEVVDAGVEGRRRGSEDHDLGVQADLCLVLGQAGLELRRLLVEVLVDAVDAAVGGD